MNKIKTTINNEILSDEEIKNLFTIEDLNNLLALLESYKHTICNAEEWEKNNKDIAEVKAMIEELRIKELNKK